MKSDKPIDKLSETSGDKPPGDKPPGDKPKKRKAVKSAGTAKSAAKAVAAAAAQSMERIAGDEPAADTTHVSVDRHQLIARTAYFRAERRGFEPGSELDDWLAAEQSIDMHQGSATESA